MKHGIKQVCNLNRILIRSGATYDDITKQNAMAVTDILTKPTSSDAKGEVYSARMTLAVAAGSKPVSDNPNAMLRKRSAWNEKNPPTVAKKMDVATSRALST